MRLRTLPCTSSSKKRADTGRMAGIHTVACLEAGKGILGLVAALMLAYLMQLSDVQVDAVFSNRAASTLLDHCLKQAVKLTGTSRSQVATLLNFALLYTAISFVEAYGLWRSRTWAKWLAVLSGTIFIPSEILSLLSAPTLSHFLVLVLNLGVVAYMLFSLRSSVARTSPAAIAC